jgi:hypothetical protein
MTINNTSANGMTIQERSTRWGEGGKELRKCKPAEYRAVRQFGGEKNGEDLF